MRTYLIFYLTQNFKMKKCTIAGSGIRKNLIAAQRIRANRNRG
jgi:hypothetical protein